MEQRISLITLGVRDLAISRAFYLDGLGWQEAAPPLQRAGLFHPDERGSIWPLPKGSTRH